MANYTFRLTATGVAELKRDLESLGPAGQAAFNRIEQGAQQAASGNRTFGQTIQQAGFQIQDFTVQVQGGTSALVALAQQGSQFLGLFGAGGAIAGAALAIGAVALQMAGLGDKTSEATDETKKLTEELKRSLEVLTGMETVSANVARNISASIDARVRAAREAAQLAESRDANSAVERLFTTDQFGNRILRTGVPAESLADAERRARSASRSVRLEPLLQEADAGRFDGGETARLRQGEELARQIANQDARAQLDRERREAEARARKEEEDRKARERAEEQDRKAREREASAEERARVERERRLSDELTREVDERTKALETYHARQFALEQAANERAAREAERQWNRMFDRTTDFAADALYDAMTGRVDDIGAAIRSTLLRAIAQGVAEAYIRPALMSGASYLGLGAGNGAGGTGASVGGFPMGGAGGFQGTLFGSPAQYNMADTLLSPATAGYFGEAGQLFGSTYAADAFLPGVGAALPGLMSGNYVQAGFGTAGALVGTYFGGPIGGAIGGTVGNVVGGLLGGKGRGNPYTQGSISLGADGSLVGYAAGDNGADPSGTQQQIDQAIAQLQGLASGRGLRFSRGADLFGDRTGRTMDQAIDEIASGLRPGAGASSSLATALNGADITGLASLQALLGKVDQFDALSAALRTLFDVTNPAEQQVRALSAQFDALTSSAAELGLSVGDVATEVAGDFNEQIRRSILGITDATALALEDQDRTNAARLELAKKIGADIAKVEELNGLERARMVRETAEAVVEAQTDPYFEALERNFAGAADRRRQAEEDARAARAASDAYRQSIASVGDSLVAEARRIREEADAALLGPYSNLSPEARLALAGERFQAGQLSLGDYLAEGARSYGTSTSAYAGFFDSALSGARARAAAMEASAANVYASLQMAPGFATGGSFDVRGPAGNDNIFMPAFGMRVTAGETVNVSRRDTMQQLVERIDRLIAVTAGSGDVQIGELRGIRRASSAASAMVRLERSR